MWILHLLPDSLLLFFTNALLTLGIVLVLAGLVVQRIPLMWRYQLPFKLAGLVLFAAGVYFRGGYGVEMDWRERVAEVQEQVKQAEQRADQYSNELEKISRERNGLLKRKSQVVIEQVDRVVIDTQCERLPRDIINLHNDAARMNQAIEELRKGTAK
jgi:hypothetical protein